ncbi:MAG: helix-turn-helix domain-containing protein [Acutalibacteraceae bacterium]
MDWQKGYYTDDLKVYLNYIENPIFKSWSYKMERYRIFVMLKGTATVVYNGEDIIVKENQLFFADNGAYFGYTFDENRSAEYFEIIVHPSVLKNTFDDDDFLRAMNKTPDDKRLIDLELTKFSPLNEIVQSLIDCIGRDAGRAHILPRIYSVLSELDFYYDEISEKRDKIFKDNLPMTIVEYVKHHYTEKITYKTISDKFFVSKPTIIKIFKAYSDCTMHEFIQELRLNSVLNLIQDNTNVVTAAKMSGFEYYSTFLRTYKARFGSLPAEHINKERPYPNI